MARTKKIICEIDVDDALYLFKREIISAEPVAVTQQPRKRATTRNVTLSIEDINAILRTLHAQARETGNTSLYSRFNSAVGRAK
jgi:hypothetical protein